VRIKQSRPERNTMPKPVCQDILPAETRLYARNALSPIPGAIAIGAFVKRPVMIVIMAVVTQVAIIRAALSIPAALKIAGFAKIIYAIVRNVVSPATISILTFVSLSEREKNPFINSPPCKPDVSNNHQIFTVSLFMIENNIYY
jgi:hypothetical protein